MTGAWNDILHTVRWYPSPHNSQPLRVRVVDAQRAEIYYDLDRGLPAEPYGIPFGSVCAGIFLELVKIAAHGLGLAVDERVSAADMDFTADDRMHPVAVVTLAPSAGPVDDLDPALITARQTSRLPYSSRRVDRAVIDELARESDRWGHRLGVTAEPGIVRTIARLNQRTLFDDIANPAVRHELLAWIRYSRAAAAHRRDGLSAECLNLPGPVLRWFLEHHRWWSRPGPGTLARWLYLRSMRGLGELAWLTGAFGTTTDHQRAGRTFIRLWLMLTARGVAMHPFGSVITNPRSHREFCRTVGEAEGDGMTWMLFRMGHSAPPPRSHRLRASHLLLSEAMV
jgi:hypothetical protein